jgi:hypothetical protein
MSKYVVKRYEGEPELWDRFVNNSNGGTIFHTLKFLSYHGDKFRKNEHHLIVKKGNELFGVMPMAVFDENEILTAQSPYGASYGGPIFRGPLTYSQSMQIIDLFLKYFINNDIKIFTLTLPLNSFYKESSDTFKLALHEHGFCLTNRDISNIVQLNRVDNLPEIFSARVRRMVKKAETARVNILENDFTSKFYQVAIKTFEKHGSTLTHSLKELQCLQSLFPSHVYVDVAYIGQHPIAGICYFQINEIINCSFYLVSDPEYQSTQALTLVIHNALIREKKKGFHYFDFGTSSVNMKGRENIFMFKENFSAIGQFRETYTWSLV